MNVLDMKLSKKEIQFIRERYPAVNLKNVGKSVKGFKEVTSLKYLDASLKHDIEADNFKDCKDPLTALKMSSEIRKKIRPFIGYERKRLT
jgi:hypothetical protein